MKLSRLSHIEEYVLQKDFVSLDELCEVFNKSKNTIRRDVSELVANGIVQKVYGGVRTVKQPGNTLVSFTERNIKSVKEKQYIGALAAKFVNDGDVIFVDSGTTTVNIVRHLSHLKGVTILTNNLYVIMSCMDLPSINTISFGGQLNRTTASFSSNFCSMENLHRFNINKVFMAATGVSIEKGATHTSPGELAIKKDLVQKADISFLLADYSKFGQTALLTYTELTSFHYVVSDRNPPDIYDEYFQEHNIQLIVK
ncbi:MAG: DeoR/GlpR family DNA-binding transcription regulator [Acetanaerobacterium sp.]